MVSCYYATNKTINLNIILNTLYQGNINRKTKMMLITPNKQINSINNFTHISIAYR